jgi:hypothetical protein
VTAFDSLGLDDKPLLVQLAGSWKVGLSEFGKGRESQFPEIAVLSTDRWNIRLKSTGRSPQARKVRQAPRRQSWGGDAVIPRSALCDEESAVPIVKQKADPSVVALRSLKRNYTGSGGKLFRASHYCVS